MDKKGKRGKRTGRTEEFFEEYGEERS